MTRPSYGAWVLATWLGWIVGVPLIAAFALAGEAVGIGGAQSLVGLGMGVGIGLMQARLMRRLIDRFFPWFCSCAIGLALPFLGADVLKAAGRQNLYSLQMCVALGGVVVGAWQAALLRARFRRTWTWLAGSALGYVLAAGAAAFADWSSHTHAIPGIPGALAYLGAIAGGGLVLGLVTGVPLRLLRA